jgi:hypothetical protein
MKTDTTTPTIRRPTARTIVGRLRGDRSQTQDAVHFHRGPQGAPAVCDDPRCASPRLDV